MFTLSTKLRNSNTPQVILSRNFQHFFLRSTPLVQSLSNTSLLRFSQYSHVVNTQPCTKQIHFFRLSVSVHQPRHRQTYIISRSLRKTLQKPYLFALNRYQFLIKYYFLYEVFNFHPILNHILTYLKAVFVKGTICHSQINTQGFWMFFWKAVYTIQF